jgi:hypothetical protein
VDDDTSGGLRRKRGFGHGVGDDRSIGFNGHAGHGKRAHEVGLHSLAVGHCERGQRHLLHARAVHHDAGGRSRPLRSLDTRGTDNHHHRRSSYHVPNHDCRGECAHHRGVWWCLDPDRDDLHHHAVNEFWSVIYVTRCGDPHHCCADGSVGRVRFLIGSRVNHHHDRKHNLDHSCTAVRRPGR